MSRVLTAVVAGVVAALIGIIPFFLCSLVSGLLAFSVAWHGLGSIGSAILVQLVQLILLVGTGAIVAAAVARVTEWFVCRVVGRPTPTIGVRALSVGATVGALTAMVVCGHLRMTLTIPLISVSDTVRFNYLLVGPACSVGAGTLALIVTGSSGRSLR
jgi:hypothetical protein